MRENRADRGVSDRERPMVEQPELVVIGMGVGGEEVAGRAAEAGMRVLGIERKLVGGECPYWGCIPSKMMVRAANALAETGRVARLAGRATAEPSWAPVAARVREATSNWDDQIAVERFEGKGGTFLRGQARIAGPRAVEVDGERFEATRGIVIATGGEPSRPPVDGLNEVAFWTNRDAIEATELPRSLVVLGAGGVVVELSDGTRAEGERLLVATGRHSDLSSLGVDAAGLDPGARAVEVDEHLRAGPGLWSVGDVTGKGAFTHMAVYQGRIAAADVLGRDHQPADYSAVPRVTFTDPEIAGVGLTEAMAREAGHRVRTGVATTASSTRGWIHGPGAEHGVAKLVADADRGVLLGGSVMGPSAGEVIGLLVLAIRQRVPVAALRELIYPYPTFVRGLEDALRQLG